MQGWIKLHRKIRNNPIFNDPQLLRLWIICLTEASHREHEQIIGKQTVKLMPGEFVTGRFDLMEMYNFGLKKCDQVKGEKTVMRWLELLEKGHFLTIKKTNKYSVVSIDKWAFYQGNDQQDIPENDQQMTNKRPSNDHQMTTNKNGNKGNNDKNGKEEILLSAFDDFWSAYPRKLDKKKAFEKFKSAAKNHDPQIIIQGAMNYAKQCEAQQTEKNFIKHPTTFLNAESFLNDFDISYSKGGQARTGVVKKSLFEQGPESRARQAEAEANYKPMTEEEKKELDELLPF